MGAQETVVRCPKLPGYTFEHHHVQEELAREPAFRRQTLVQYGDHMVVRAIGTRLGRRILPHVDAYSDDDVSNRVWDSYVPAWIKYGEMVLCFNAICGKGTIVLEGDAAAESEGHIVARVVYHLDDSTFEVLYDDKDRKGRVFFKRYTNHSDLDQLGTRVSTKVSFDPFKVQIGDNLQIFGHSFMIFDADQRTREFRSAHGCPVGAPIPVCLDEETQEMALPKVDDEEKITSYLTCTSKPKRDVPLHWKDVVLRFWATTDTSGSEQEEEFFLIQYYIEDSSIELRQCVDSTMLKTTRYLSRTTLVDPVASMIQAGNKKMDVLQLHHVLVGNRVTICGKHLFVFKTDDQSLQWMTQNIQHIKDIVREVPIPRNSSTRGKTPKRAMREQDKGSSFPPPPTGVNEMQFLAQFSISTKRISSVDKERKFVITVHCSDETVSIREMHRPNSGIMSGKFLERQKAYRTGTDKSNPLRPVDFYIGVAVEIYGHWFDVLDADIATIQYIAMNPQYFSCTDGSQALEDVRNALASSTFNATCSKDNTPVANNPIWNGHSVLLQGLQQSLPQYSMQEIINSCILLLDEE